MICANEMIVDDSENIPYKICKNCVSKSDPTNDYDEAKNIVKKYIYQSIAKEDFNFVKNLIDTTSDK